MGHGLILEERHLLSGHETSREQEPHIPALVSLLLVVSTRRFCVYQDSRAIARH